MLSVQGLSKAYGGHQVLRGVSCVVNRGEKLAVLGPNGAGKSTLLRVIAGLETPDGGRAALSPPSLRLGYLPQGYHDAGPATVAQSFPELARTRLLELEVGRLAEALARASPNDADGAAAEYAGALAGLESSRRVLEKSGLAPLLGQWAASGLDLDRPVASLSGGEQTRLGLVRLALEPADVLLVDEPTNHLDIAGLEWLEGFLRDFAGALVFVTHDRALLTALATHVLDLAPGAPARQPEDDPSAHRLFGGGYADYVETRRREREEQAAAYGRQQRQARRVKEHIRDLKQRALRVELTTTHFHYRKRAAKVARQAVVMQRRLERSLESGQRIEKPQKSYPLRPRIATPGGAGDLVVSVEDVSLEFDGRPLLHDVTFDLYHRQRAALVGPNGSGKTSLLRLIAGELAPTTGGVRIGPSARIGVFEQERAARDDASTPLEAVRLLKPMTEAEARRFLHRYLITADDALTPIDSLSYGQRARLALARLVLQGASFLMLDEPTNFLDIPSREAFEEALAAFSGTVLVVTHDRHFLEQFPDLVLSIEGGTVRRYL